MQTNVGSAISGHTSYGTLSSRRGGSGGTGTLSHSSHDRLDKNDRHADRSGGSVTTGGSSVVGGSIGGGSSSGDMGYKTGTWGRRRTTSNGEFGCCENKIKFLLRLGDS